MPIDPAKRAGKGAFPDGAASVEVDNRLIDDVIKKAQTRTVLFDYLYMIFVGFLSALTGTFQIKGKTNEQKESSLEK